MLDNKYTFISHKADDYSIQEEMNIADLVSGCLFCAKDEDGEYIVDTDGNNVFESCGTPNVDELGPYVYCTVIGRV